ncbi:MAG: hypothetical protein Q9219_004008 [cf. Caloplaca sp. 3 TL-2023]
MAATLQEATRVLVRQVAPSAIITSAAAETAISCDAGNEYDGRIGVRISAIFVILVGSLFGAVFPVFAARHRGVGVPQWAFFVAKYFGSGVIIATAFIHLLAPANEALTNPCLTGPITDYAWVEGIALMTVFLLFFIELMAMRYATFDHGNDHTAGDTEMGEHIPPSNSPRKLSISSPHAPGEDHLGHNRQHRDHNDNDHIYGLEHMEDYAAQMTAIFILEFGVIFHSIFIGLTLAVAGEEFKTLYVVLVFHQTFEGLGLGSRLAAVAWPKSKQWTPYILGTAYALSTPIALAIGLGLKTTYSPGSQTALIVNGVFDSISAGILIYTGLVELMAHEFMFSPTMRKAPMSLVLRAFGVMCLGAGLMALLAKPHTFIKRQVSRMASTLPKLPVFQAIASHDPRSTAVVHCGSGRRFTYGQLLNDVAESRTKLRQSVAGRELDGERIAFLVENSYDYVVTLLSILGSNSVAVPLSPSFPASELRYILDDSKARMLLSSVKFHNKADEVLKENLKEKPTLGTIDKRLENVESTGSVPLEDVTQNHSGMMLYTSGTTSRPKGVLLPESVLTAQCQSLMQAWKYIPEDHLLHVLPLHHIHGTINALLTALFAGSTIEFLFPFNVQAVWERFAAPFVSEDSKRKEKITFFTVVPTIYNRLLSSHSGLNESLQKATKEALLPANLRLNISGSAALPTPTKSAWTELSGGNILLERYGMTEVGMALSCGMDVADRVDGSVGWPLPFVEARLVDTETKEVIKFGEEMSPDGKEKEGEIQLRGPTVFREYWRNPKATTEEFTDDEDGQGRWFKTGDVATRRVVEGAGRSGQEWAKGPMYFIRGRRSVDIIKSGGEKVSALEIERELLSLSAFTRSSFDVALR